MGDGSNEFGWSCRFWDEHAGAACVMEFGVATMQDEWNTAFLQPLAKSSALTVA
jgi:hypothetical protein